MADKGFRPGKYYCSISDAHRARATPVTRMMLNVILSEEPQLWPCGYSADNRR